MSETLIILARAPGLCAVKTRLAKDLGKRLAESFYQAFIKDTLLFTRELKGITRVLFSYPNTQDPFLINLAKRENIEILAQQGSDLGERMKNAIFWALSKNKRVCLIGTDSPSLPYKFIQSGFEMLKRFDLIIGPALDGGYYLLGLRKEVSQIFTDIKWGDENVLISTIKKAKKEDISFSLLPFWYDIDTKRDLEFLGMHLDLLWGEGERIAPSSKAMFIKVQDDMAS
jgi:hypothetical protein